jgi:hypothetical protein
MALKLDKDAIRWPGNTSQAPVGILIPTHLKVLTIEEKPFVYVRETQNEDDCTPEEIPCPHFNNSADSNGMFNKHYIFFFFFSSACEITGKEMAFFLPPKILLKNTFPSPTILSRRGESFHN